jgi:hypothetical protein
MGGRSDTILTNPYGLVARLDCTGATGFCRRATAPVLEEILEGIEIQVIA